MPRRPEFVRIFRTQYPWVAWGALRTVMWLLLQTYVLYPFFDDQTCRILKVVIKGKKIESDIIVRRKLPTSWCDFYFRWGWNVVVCPGFWTCGCSAPKSYGNFSVVLLDAVSDRFGGSRLSYQRLENALHRHWSPGSSNSSWLVVSSTNLLQFFFFFFSLLYFCACLCSSIKVRTNFSWNRWIELHIPIC